MIRDSSWRANNYGAYIGRDSEAVARLPFEAVVYEEHEGVRDIWLKLECQF